MDKRHVLFVNYFFPPAVGGGVPRPVKLAKYLGRLGWTVSVVTIAQQGEIDELLDSEGATIARVREWRLGTVLGIAGGAVRAARRLWEIFSPMATPASSVDRGVAFEEQEIESSKIGWVIPATCAALRIHRRQAVDVVVVSSPPASSGTVGWLLHALAGVPYVVEYRDPWTVGAFWTADADGHPRTDPVTRARYGIARRLESALLRGARGAIIVNGPRHVARLRGGFARALAGKAVVQIRNGIDLEDVAEPRTDADPGALRLLHAGFFYHFHTPHHVVAALADVARTRPEHLADVEIEFMGAGFPAPLLRQALAAGLGEVVRTTPACTYSVAIAAMQAADGLIIVLPPLESDRDRLPTKVYEYLATDHPILAVVHPDGATAELLDGVADVLVADSRDVADIASTFVDFVRLVRMRKEDGPPPEGRNRGRVHHYGSRAAQLDSFLRTVSR